MKLLSSSATAILTVAFVTPISVQAVEWETACGVSMSRLSACKVVKGDATLKGRNGMSYTYTLSNGVVFQRFIPSSAESVACNQRGYMRKGSGSWFNISSRCERSGGNTYEIYQLPSGNSMMVELYW